MAIAVTAEKNSLATKYGADALFGTVFTADPGATGTATGEVTGGAPAFARKSLVWGAPTAGVVTATAVFDIPASTTVTFVGVCSTGVAAAATVLDKLTVTSQLFSVQGTYTVTFTFTLT